MFKMKARAPFFDGTILVEHVATGDVILVSENVARRILSSGGQFDMLDPLPLLPGEEKAKEPKAVEVEEAYFPAEPEPPKPLTKAEKVAAEKKAKEEREAAEKKASVPAPKAKP